MATFAAYDNLTRARALNLYGDRKPKKLDRYGDWQFARPMTEPYLASVYVYRKPEKYRMLYSTHHMKNNGWKVIRKHPPMFE